LALSPWHIEWSQHARFYMPLLIFYTLALMSFFYGIENDKPGYLGLSILLLYLATRERLFAMYFIPIVIGYIVLLSALSFEKPPGFRFRNFAGVLIASLVISLLLGEKFVKEPTMWANTFHYVTAGPLDIFLIFVSKVSIPIIFLSLIGAYILYTQRDRIVLFLVLSAYVPLLTVLAMSPFQFTSERYIFVSLPSWLTLASLAVVSLKSNDAILRRILSPMLAIILLMTYIYNDYVYYRFENGSRADWKSAFKLVKQRMTPDDLVVTPAAFMGITYLGVEERDGIVIDYFNIDLDFIVNNDKRVWIVHNRRRLEPLFVKWVEENCELIEVLDVYSGVEKYEMRVYLYKPAIP
jgi:mannosyltransferase